MAKSKIGLPWLIDAEGVAHLPHYIGYQGFEIGEEEDGWCMGWGEPVRVKDRPHMNYTATHYLSVREKAPIIGTPVFTGAGRGRSAAYLTILIKDGDKPIAAGCLSIFSVEALMARIMSGDRVLSFMPRKMGQNYLFEYKE